MLVAALSSPAVSSLMTGAASGLNALRDAVTQAQHSVLAAASSQSTRPSDVDDDVIDDFEFLNDDEFNRTDD